MDFKRNTDVLREQAENAAQEELKNYSDIPEHYSVIMKYPNMDAKGYFSEIDMDIAARLKKCDIYAQRKTIYEQAMYNHVRQEIETKGADLKKEVQEISKQHRVLTRAARLCEDTEAKKALLDKAESLKESEPVKNYNMLISGLEFYAGIGPAKMERKVVNALDSLIGYITSGNTNLSGQGKYYNYRERPEQVKFEFRNMDEYFEQFKLSHPQAKGKTQEELDALYPSYDLFEKSVLQYGKDALEDTLNSCFDSLDERLDLIMINGETLREMLDEKEENKNRSPQELNDLGCNLLTAALKSGARVEAFMLESADKDNRRYYAEPVPMKATEPEERVTMTFWETFLSKFGFYKEKVQKLKEQQEMDRKIEACRKRVMDKMSKTLTPEEKAAGKKQIQFAKPMTKEEKDRLQMGREIAKENCENFVRDARIIEQTQAANDTLNYSFFPEEGINGDEVKIEGKEVRLGREKPLYNCVNLMLRKGIPYEEAIDPTKHKELRVQIGKALKEKVATMTEAEYEKLHVDGFIRMSQCVDDYAKKMSKEITSAKDIGEKFVQLYKGIRIPHVVQMDVKKTESAIVQCGGEEKLDAYAKKIQETSMIYNLGTRQTHSLDKYYNVLQGKPIKMSKFIYDKMQKVDILQGLQSKNPTFCSKLTEENSFNYQALMQDHPEVVKLQEKANNMDRELLNDLLATDGEKQVHMELEFFEEKLPNLTTIGTWKPKSFEFDLNVVINGEGIAKFDVPQKQVTEHEKTEMENEPDEFVK